MGMLAGVLDRSDGASLTVQFFQGELFGFSDETEDHEPGDEVETGVETD